ncbi:MAG: ribosome biogenesis GTP-binding protein YihA/YsxC [Mycoplasmoidaceae bacterium]
MAIFIKSAFSEEDWIHDEKVEICFIGRSNVGKSSLINALAKEKISRTSNTPGRTQLVNFFDFGKFRLIDLPGYGYAKVSKEKKEELNTMIETFLVKRNNLYAVFQICDAGVITERDQKMANFLKHKFSNFYIILNKVDQQNKSYLNNYLSSIAKYLKVDEKNFIAVSAKKNTNINKLEQMIDQIIKQ